MTSPGAHPNYSTADQLVAGLGPLPPTAQVLARLQGLLADPNSGLDDVATLIRLDAAMTTRVIKISNSAWFGRGGPCHTIEEAVNRIGFREVFQLVSLVASGALVAQPLNAYNRDATMCWRESVSCAFAAEVLAERLGEDIAASLMNGLLHPIGRQAFNRYAFMVDKTMLDAGFPNDFSGSEFALLGFTQADAAACMLKKWNFTPENIEPVRKQYEPLAAHEPYDRLSAILYAARLLRSTICTQQPVEETLEESDILSLIKLTRQDVLDVQPIVEQKLTRAEQIAKI